MKVRLKILILEKGFTIKELSEDLGFSPQTVSNWCNGRNLDNIYSFYKLCKKLDIDIKDIFTE